MVNIVKESIVGNGDGKDMNRSKWVKIFIGILAITICLMGIEGTKDNAAKAATAKPKVTAKPKTAAKSKATAKPKTTAKPKATLKPKATAKPKATKKPNTVSPKSLPYKKKFMKKKEYNKQTKQYFMLRSYLEKLGSKGGGTLTLKKGTYKIPCTLYIPSNVTIKLQNGARILKTKQTGTYRLTPTQFLFETVSGIKAKKKRKVAGYGASQNVKITGTGKAVIDLGFAQGRCGIYVGHSSGITVEGISFKNKKGSNYILVEGSRNVKISKCKFYAGKNVSGKKNKMAIRLENIHPETDTFPEKWGKTDKTLNQGITVDGCTFYKQEIAIGSNECQATGTTDAPVLFYQMGIRITNNVFVSPTINAVYAKGWNAPEISGNVMKRGKSAVKVESFILGNGVANPKIKGNTFNGCEYAIQFGKAWAYGIGDAVVLVNSDLGSASLDLMLDNVVKNCDHYFVLNGRARILYFRDKTEKNFTVSVNSQPYREHYTNTSKYNSRKLYYMFKSYMEQLEYAGGGTLTVEPGNYMVSGNICVPSNVTVNLKNGVTFTKVAASSGDGQYSKGIFTIVPPSKEGIVSSVKGYGGSQNVRIAGSGKVVMNCNNVLEAMAVVMGHAKNVTIQGITFQNGYGSHFIELNSSYNVVIENCVFQNFKVSEEKSYKECINVDGTDANTKGFNCRWSAHDKTMCQKICIRKNTFRNVGTAVGSHTYSASGNNQLYHDNVQILNNIVENTYNSAVRALNWKNCIIRGNTFKNIQSLSDGRKNESGSPVLYPAVSLKGVLNPTVTQNTINSVKFFPVIIDMETAPTTPGAVKAGYPDSISSVSEKNYTDMQINTFQNIEENYRYVLTRETEMQSLSAALYREITVK